MAVTRPLAELSVAAAWQVRDRLPDALRPAIETSLVRAAGAIAGLVPVLRVAHLYPRPAEQRPEGSEEGLEAWQVAMTALAASLRFLLNPEVPEERATLHWLGLLGVTGKDAESAIDRAAAMLGHAPRSFDSLDVDPVPRPGTLEDPYDDVHLALVPYLRDQARLEAHEPRVGPAEAAMMLGPEPIVGSREALGLSFLRWRETPRGLEAMVRCRLHALSHEQWALVVPDVARARRARVRAYLSALRSVIAGSPALSALRHVRPPRPDSLTMLLDLLISPATLTSSDDNVDFEARIEDQLGGVVPALESDWPVSPFRRIEWESGSVRKAMELVAPTILEVARERFQGELEIAIDDYEECWLVERVEGAQRTLLERVRTEAWQP